MGFHEATRSPGGDAAVLGEQSAGGAAIRDLGEVDDCGCRFGGVSAASCHAGVEVGAAAKRGMVQTLATMRTNGALDFDASRREIEAIIATVLSAGIAAGDLRVSVNPADLRSLLAGILAAAEDREQVRRLFDLRLAGAAEKGVLCRYFS